MYKKTIGVAAGNVVAMSALLVALGSTPSEAAAGAAAAGIGGLGGLGVVALVHQKTTIYDDS